MPCFFSFNFFWNFFYNIFCRQGRTVYVSKIVYKKIHYILLSKNKCLIIYYVPNVIKNAIYDFPIKLIVIIQIRWAKTPSNIL